MRVAMFSVRAFDRDFFDEANQGRGHDLRAITQTTLDNISAFEQGRRSGNELY